MPPWNRRKRHKSSCSKCNQSKCKCYDDHDHHHDNGCDRTHYPSGHSFGSTSGEMKTSMAGQMVSTRDWSKIPEQNFEVGGVPIGCNMSGSDIPFAFQAIAAGVANLTAQIGAGATWGQFETPFGIRKYEGDAGCIFTLKPKPAAWVISNVTPPAPEGPHVVRDCLARTWVSCDSEFVDCEPMESDDGSKTTYTFPQTLGDGTKTGEVFSITIPTIRGLPEFPAKSADPDALFMVCYDACTHELTWEPKPDPLRVLTDAEASDGDPFPEGTVLTPQQTCEKIEEALGVLSGLVLKPTDAAGKVYNLECDADGNWTVVEAAGGGGDTIPAGGTEGQYLTRNAAGDLEWRDLPAGGTGAAMTDEQIHAAVCRAPVDDGSVGGAVRPIFCREVDGVLLRSSVAQSSGGGS